MGSVIVRQARIVQSSAEYFLCGWLRGWLVGTWDASDLAVCAATMASLRLTNQSSLVVILICLPTINATIGSYATLVIGGPLDKRLAGTSAASGSCRQSLANHVPPLSALRPFPSPNLDPCSLPAAQTPSRSALQGIRLVKSHHPPQKSNLFRQHGCPCHRGPCV